MTLEIEEPKKPVPLEETTSGVTVDLQYVYTVVPVQPERHYCVLYDHVQHRLTCAIDGYEHLPKDEIHGFHQASSFKKGERSAYIKYAELDEDPNINPLMPPNDGRVTTGEYLHGKNPNVVTPAETRPVLHLKLYAGGMYAPQPVHVGDWVLVRGKVTEITKSGEHVVSFACRAGHRDLAVETSEILCKTTAPIPIEPNHGHILVSEKDGSVWQWDGEEDIWTSGGNQATWPTLWEINSPFREYYASRVIR